MDLAYRNCLFCSWLAIAGLGCRDSVGAPPASHIDSRLSKPVWPHMSTAEVTTCGMLRTSDYVVKVQPLSVGAPYMIELSPWRGYKYWVTPVTWLVKNVLVSRPVPGKVLTPLPSTITTAVGAEYLDATTVKIIGVTKIDSVLVTSPARGLAQGPSGWLMESGSEAFPTEAAVLTAFQAASQNPLCDRVDMMEQTRLANEARLLTAPSSSPLTSQADAGNIP